jgi:hypothetical protein
MLIDSLIGTHIVNIYVATWERGTFNNADFIYELSDGRYVRLPDFYVSVTEIETCELDARYRPVNADWNNQYHPNIFGRPIIDILIPRDPGIRTSDNAALKLDSGFYLMQESGAPQGILPDILLVEAIDSLQMQSVFETEEWIAIKSIDAGTSTERSGDPETPNARVSHL